VSMWLGRTSPTTTGTESSVAHGRPEFQDVVGVPYQGAPTTYVVAFAAGLPLRAQRWAASDFVIGLVLAVIVPIAVLGVAQLAGAPTNGTVFLLGSLMLPWVGLGVWPWYVTRHRGNGIRIDLGFEWHRSDVVWGVGGAAVSIAVGSLVIWITTKIFGEYDSAAGQAALAANVPRWVIVVFAIAAVIGAPLCEEICFRGFAFALIARWADHRSLAAVPWATICSAVLFASIHMEPVRIPVLLVLGLVFSLLRARTGRIGASVIAHSLNNIIPAIGIVTAAWSAAS